MERDYSEGDCVFKRVASDAAVLQIEVSWSFLSIRLMWPNEIGQWNGQKLVKLKIICKAWLYGLHSVIWFVFFHYNKHLLLLYLHWKYKNRESYLFFRVIIPSGFSYYIRCNAFCYNSFSSSLPNTSSIKTTTLDMCACSFSPASSCLTLSSVCSRPKVGYLVSWKRRISFHRRRKSNWRRTSRFPPLQQAGSSVKVARRWVCADTR